MTEYTSVMPPSRSSSTVGRTSPELNAGCSVEKTNRPRGVKRGRIAEREEGFLVHRVGVSVFDIPAVRTGPLEHPLAEVDCKHLPAELGHPARELAVPARDFEDPLSLLESQQPFDRRLDEVPLPGRAGLHALVPKACQLVPCGSDVIVQPAFLAHTVKRSRPSVANRRAWATRSLGDESDIPQTQSRKSAEIGVSVEVGWRRL